MTKLMLLLGIALNLISQSSIAQDQTPVTFNKVKPSDFSPVTEVDTSHGAVIIADLGKSYFEGNTTGWFTLVFEHKRRVRIIDKKGYDLATVSVPLYHAENSMNEEKLESVKAITYNLENGKVTETKFDKSDIYKEKLNDRYNIKKFTLPAVRDGSIIEYSYTIKSDFLFNLQPWKFQGDYPALWSEYSVNIPSFFRYVVLSQGYFPYHIKTSKEIANTYSVLERNAGSIQSDDLYKIPSNDIQTRWVIRNVPAMKEEKFTSSISNHIAQVEFQLSGYNFPSRPFKNIMGNWEIVSKELLNDKNFGADLTDANRWMNSELAPVIAGSSGDLEIANRIYKYVQSNIKNKGTRGIYLSQTLKETFRSKSGHVPDINLLLTMLLMNQDMKAEPVLLSTRSNGFANEVYPLMNKFNYVICRLTIGSDIYYLDASQPYLGFNKLPSYCYNGAARVINKNSAGIQLTTDDITEAKLTIVNLSLDEKNQQNWTGKLNSTLGYYESSMIRKDIMESGKDGFVKKTSEYYSGDMSASNIDLSDLDKLEKPLQVSYKLDIANKPEDFIYFNPMIKEGMSENIFKSDSRKYPIEMPYKTNETYVLKISVPKGYIVDEAPKSARVKFNENEALFEYLVSHNESEVDIRTTLSFDRTIFLSEDYETLRDFFDLIVKKHAEQIVFKKKS